MNTNIILIKFNNAHIIFKYKKNELGSFLFYLFLSCQGMHIDLPNYLLPMWLSNYMSHKTITIVIENSQKPLVLIKPSKRLHGILSQWGNKDQHHFREKWQKVVLDENVHRTKCERAGARKRESEKRGRGRARARGPVCRSVVNSRGGEMGPIAQQGLPRVRVWSQTPALVQVGARTRQGRWPLQQVTAFLPFLKHTHWRPILDCAPVAPPAAHQRPRALINARARTILFSAGALPSRVCVRVGLFVCS